jgi:hypothetical protein
MAPSVKLAPPMIVRQVEDDPRVAGWLVPGDNCTKEGYEIVCRGVCDEGIWEEPWGSNESQRINRYTKFAGYEPPQYWCGIWLGKVYADRGMYVPEFYGAVDWWLPYAQPTSLALLKQRAAKGGEFARALPGAAIIYGQRGTIPLQDESGRAYHPDYLKRFGWDGRHIEMITRAEPNAGAPGGVAIATRGGNRGYGITHNTGVAVDEAPTERLDVIAVHFPKRAPGYVPKRQVVRPEPA